MNMGEASRYLTNFVDELAQNGMEHVVISPGSRSTPLALTFTEHPTFRSGCILMNAHLHSLP